MDIKVEVHGLKGVEEALSQAGPKLAKRAMRKALQAGGELLMNSAKSRAPVLKGPGTRHRQPGELRDSIGMKIKLSPKEEAGRVSVGPLKDKSKGRQSPGVWGMFVEFGSVHGAAQPFMRPGFDSAAKPALDAFTDVIRANVETLDK